MEISERLPAAFRVPLARFTGSRFGAALLRFAEQLAANDVLGLAAEMAYHFLFALFPFLIFLAALLNALGAVLGQQHLLNQLLGFIAPLLPSSVQEILETWEANEANGQSTGLLTIGALGALWGAGGGINALVKGLNRAYGVTGSRSFLRAHALALAVTLILTVTLIGVLGLFTLGDWLTASLSGGFGPGAGFRVVSKDLQAPVITVGLWVILVMLYRWLPDERVEWRNAIPGAIFAGLGWIAVSQGFGYYILHFGSFDRTFGTLGAAALLMFWMYAVALILLVGGEINALLSKQQRGPWKSSE